MDRNKRRFPVLGLITAGLFVCAPGVLRAQAPVAGQNVNMVSGTQWPGGDPFLQRQNEPSLAVSSRNPLHLLAGANDYRTVDLPLQDSVPAEGLAGDAWLGVFKSFNGGQSWQSTLLPGYPQDLTAAGLASPVKGFTTAADPVVRAGTNGLFYYSGMVFNRGTNQGRVFVSVWIDLDNKENGDATSTTLSMNSDPIRYVRTVSIADGNAGQFLDKPWLAVDIPRSGAGTCNIQVPQPGGATVSQSFPGGNVYMTYSTFVGNDINIRTKLYFTRSTDCGATWGNPTKLSEGYPINQGSIIAIDPSTGYVYVAWRGFSTINTANTINIVKSTDGGVTFTKALTVVSLPNFDPANPTAASFFDQGTTGTSFRTNAFPGLAVDGAGRVYLAWSQRDPSAGGDARIWMKTSPDGATWSTAFLVDGNPILDDMSGTFTRGNQFMPSMTFSRGKVVVLYYDQRLDHTLGLFWPNEPFNMAHGLFYKEQRALQGELLNPGGTDLVFNSVVSDAGLPLRRHTIDVRVAEGNPSSAPFFTSARVSQYKFGTRGGVSDLDILQLQVNPPNLPMFQLGQVPFLGDYIDIAGPTFTTDASGHWTFDTAPSAGAVHYAAWTTNQDVVPPVDPVTHVIDWTKHTPPISIMNPGDGSNSSIYDPTQKVPACTNPLFTGSRNQNIYSSRITQGLLVASPQNSKPLSTLLQREFVVNVRNETSADRSFRLTIGDGTTATQPAGGYASFTPGLNNPGPPAAPPTPPSPVVMRLDVTVGAHAGVSRSVFAVSSNPVASITINVAEIDHPDPGGSVVPDGLSSFLVLNADGTVPPLADPDGAPQGSNIQTVEIYNPNVTNPNVTNPNVTNPNVTNVNTQNPNVTNPNVTNPNVTNPNVTNPNVTNPNVTNADIAIPNVTNPNVTNPNVTNPNVTNPNVTSPNVTNPNVTNYPVADSTYTITNTGNTTATYQVKLVKLSDQQTSTTLQLMVNKAYATLASDNCYLFPQFQNTLQVNVTNPVFTPLADLGNRTVNDPNVTNPTLSLAPGETALVTLRGYFPQGTTDIQAQETMQQITETAAVPVVIPEAPNTNDPTNTPAPAVPGGIFITTTALPDATVGQPYSQTLQQVGGVAPVTWSVVFGTLPPGFALNAGTGTITNANPAANVPETFSFTIQAADSAAHVATRPLTLNVNAPVIISTVSEFTVPTAESHPYRIAEGPDGALWFAESAGNKIGRITPAGVITEYSIPTAGSSPAGITAGPDGALWFTESSGNQIGRITTAGVITEYPVLTAGSAPYGIAKGPDGALWFTEGFGNKIGRITTAGVITEYPALTAGSDPAGITAGPDGNLWFTELQGNRIGRITTAGVVTEFPMPGGTPDGIVAGPDGNLWFAERLADRIGRITPAGVITEFSLPTAGSEPIDIAAGPDGALWFTEFLGAQIGRITTAGVIDEFPIPTAIGPFGIAAGPDGALWFTEYGGNRIGRIPVAGLITEFPVPTAGSGPVGIAKGSDGALWFTEFYGHQIGRIPTAGTIAEFPVPTVGFQPVGIAAGPDGALWFTEYVGNLDKIGRITTAGVITEFSITTASTPDEIVAGPDGALWFTEYIGNRIGRITTAGVVTEFPLPTSGSEPSGIAAGTDGNLWFTELAGNRIGRITTAGVITEFPVPTASSEPWAIAAGPDGALWFTESTGNKIGRITTAGVITEFPLPTAGSLPLYITAGPDGNLWFGEDSGNRIGRITPTGVITEFPIPTATSAPYGIAAGPDGYLWFTEAAGDRIGRIR